VRGEEALYGWVAWLRSAIWVFEGVVDVREVGAVGRCGLRAVVGGWGWAVGVAVGAVMMLMYEFSCSWKRLALGREGCSDGNIVDCLREV